MLMMTRQFDDIDTFTKAIQPLHIVANQLSPGRFIGNINFAAFDSIKFYHSTYNQSLRVKGAKSPSEIIFAISLPDDQTQMLSHGVSIQTGDIFGFDPNRETDLITQKDPHIVFTAVSLSVFQSLAEQMGYYNLGQNFFRQNFIRFNPAQLKPLRVYYHQIIQVLSQQESLLNKFPSPSLIQDDFLPLLINTVGETTRQKSKRVKTLRRYPIIKKAEDIFQSYSDQPLTLKQLCDELGTSSSALAYGFQDIFGISPMAYLKIQRLNGVHRALKSANPTKTVMQIAHQWGFWNAAHFSQDYKKMFGQLPSKTLQQNF